MPSVSSSSKPKVLLSSTVMTPSLPTLSIASAIMPPMALSPAEIEAVEAICSLVSTSLEALDRSSQTASTAASMPFFRPIGLAPAATLRRPSRTSAWARMVAVVREGLRNVAAGANPMGLKKGIEAAVEAVCEDLSNASKDVETKEQIASTASISAGDKAIGGMIAEAMDKVGKEGVITVEESNTFGLELELTEGMRFDKGYISPYFVTDPERMEAVLDDPYLLVVNSKIAAVKDLLP